MLRSPPPAVALFLLAVLLHAGLAVVLREPAPGGLRSDENVYLELAANLWLDGTYGTKVSVTYPPGYPLFAAPAFAIADNAARFAALRVGQALALAAASLLLLPGLAAALGRTRAWVALAGLQLVGGAVFHGVFAQSEALYLVLLVAATGLVEQAWRTDRGSRFLALGLVAGLSVATRRMGVVVPIALGLLLLIDARQDRALPLRRAAALALGGLLGLFPEAVAAALHGDVISPYEGSAATDHLAAGAQALGSARGLGLLLRTTGAQLAWPLLTALGAPLLIAAALLDRRLADPLPRPTARTLAFVLLALLGSTALTVLHIVRYRLRTENVGWDLYPRYLDPLELPLLAAGLLALAALAGRAPPRRALLPWAGGLATILVLCGPVLRSRGGRMIPPVRLAEDWGALGALAPWIVAGGAAVGGGLALLALARRGPLARRPLLWLLCALAAGWLVSIHVPVRALTDRAAPPPPAVLRAPALLANPTAPLAVVVYRPGPFGRRYYEPAFRSDHPVRFLAEEALPAWTSEHPDGFVLVHRKDDRTPPGLERVGRAGDWFVLQAEPR